MTRSDRFESRPVLPNRSRLLERVPCPGDFGTQQIHYFKAELWIRLQTVEKSRSRNEGEFGIVDDLGRKAIRRAGDRRR